MAPVLNMSGLGRIWQASECARVTQDAVLNKPE